SAGTAGTGNGGTMKRAGKTITTEELLIWTYQRQRADMVIRTGAGLYEQERMASGLEAHGSSPDGCVAVARNAAIGATIGGSMAPGAVHPDAETVHEQLERLGDMARFLLLDYGRTGMAPDWLPGARIE